jgi:oligopeptide/dipeptide ABC transporter ATP-binding protein
MHAGEIVECRETAEIFRDPHHPYTKELIRALPVVPQFAQATVGGS